MISPAVFRRQLRHWSFHCVMNALPSLGIALGFLELWKRPVAIAAMLAAIATFILLYTCLTSLPGPLADSTSILSRALRVGAKIRAWISGLSLPLLPTGAVMITPDFWCGFLAMSLLDSLSKFLGSPQLFAIGRGTNQATFLPVFATTMLEGFILSAMLLLFSFFAVLILQAKERKKWLAQPEPRP